MNRRNIVVSLFLFSCTFGAVHAQREKSDIREGNRLFKSEKFEESEVSYRKALDAQNSSIPGNFNLGDALYRQEKYEEAGKQFSEVSIKNSSKEVLAQAFHNLGNSLLHAEKLDESIEAYKNALRQNPGDMETKYNLAYAQNLKKQQEDKQQDKNQDQDQDKQDKNKDQQNQQDQNQDKQDKQDQQDQQQNQDEQQQEQKQQPKISKEDAQRLLDALANDEKKTQEKVKLAKAKSKKSRSLKEW